MTSDGELLLWSLALALGMYLTSGLAVALRLYARRKDLPCRGEDGEVAQFLVEALLWPAAQAVSRRR
jgi:hypothetical protein